MVIVLFHMLYLLGKCMYKSYHVRKQKALCDAAREAELFEQLREKYEEIYGDVSRDTASINKVRNRIRFSPPAYIQRYNAVKNVLIDPKYQGELRKIVDFGCAKLAFLTYLKNIDGVEEILCVDINKYILEDNQTKAAPLNSDYFNPRKKPLVIEIYKGSVTHPDNKLKKTDAVICIELIEHLYPDTLIDLPFNIFGYIMPKVVIITTPNADFNILFPNFSGYRDPDHKFEWTREQFQDWAQNIVVRYPCYSVTFHGICDGPKGTEELGACTQMAVFHRLSPIKEYSQRIGIDGLFKPICRYDYPIDNDTRSDEEKLLDEVVYYIHFLCSTKLLHEVYLSNLLPLLENYVVTIEALKTILVEAGWTVADRENGPVVLIPQLYNSSDNSISEDILRDANSTYEESKYDYELTLNETSIRTNDESSLVQNLYTKGWHEEPSIVIPESRCIVQENTSLSDGEYIYVIDDLHIPDDTYSVDTLVKHSSNTTKSSVFTERELSSNLTEMDDGAQISDPNTSVLSLSSAISSNSLKLKDATKNSSIDNVTIELVVSQNDEINLKTIQRDDSKLNFQPHLSVSRSSTSPEPLGFNSELNNSLQNCSANYQNESYNSFLLNSTFHQSEIADEAVVDIEKSTIRNILGFNENIPEKYNLQGSKINFPKCMSPNYSKVNNSCNLEQDNIISVENQAYDENSMSPKCMSPNYSKVNNSCNLEQDNIISVENQAYDENSDMVSLNIYSSSPNNQPKFTSSPKIRRKMPTIISTNSFEQKCIESKNLISATDRNISLSITEVNKKIASDISSDLLENTSQESNSNTTVKVIVLCSASSNSDVTNTSKYDVDCSTSNNTQKVCLENKKFNNPDNSTSTELIQSINEKFAEKVDIINHETNVVNDVQNIDAQHILSLGDKSIKHKEENVSRILTAALVKTDNTDTKVHLKNMISDSAQSNINKKSLSPPRELLNFKSQNDNKCSSSECAKETSILENNRFIPCRSNEDTNNVQFISVLKSEGNVGTSKDVNISNIAGLMDNIEAKSSSPLETPPNSWSPEIMDSGYPNSTSAQDITPEYDLSSIAQDHIPDSESPSVAEAPRLDVLEPVEVENGDLANNNRDDEGNNMMGMNAEDIENLQPLFDVLADDLQNENDIYIMQNGFPIWLLRILNVMANPLDFDMPDLQDMPVADDVNYVGHDEGFDSSSSGNESDIAYNEMENDNEHEE